MEQHQLIHLSNEELLKKYQQADTLAFNEFFERNKKLIFHYLLWRLRNRSDAEDAFQKTFFRIHQHILKYDANQSALGWVMTIAKHAAFDLNSRRAFVTQSFDEGHSEKIDTQSEGMLEARSLLVGIVATLEPEEQRLLERRFFYEDSFDEIGDKEGWSPENTRQKVSRLVRRLKARMIESAS